MANFLLKSAEYDIKLDIIEMVTISDGPALIVYIRIKSNQEDLLCPEPKIRYSAVGIEL